jgi:GMP synthase-like glutamine amidotransferase
MLVLQHIACEPPGVFEDVMVERGIAMNRVELDEGEPLPRRGSFDAIVAMGGPMSVNDEDDHPWLAAEKALIGAEVRAGTPFFGACLGVQLLAASLGARVHPGPAPEVGVLPVTLTAAGRADPVTGVLPAELPGLQWHGDTFELPAGAVLLASSPAYEHQAIRVGRSAYGIQFHVEVTESMAAEWGRVPAYATAAEAVLGAGGIDRLLADFAGRADELQRLARLLFERWLDTACAAS